MKKTLVALASALALAGGVSTPGCTNYYRQQMVASQYEQEDELRHSLDEIMSSVFCIRTVSSYVNVDDPSDIHEDVSHATLFAYRADGGETYLVTNAHAVTDRDEVTIHRMRISPEGLFERSEQTYRRVNSRSYIVNNEDDETETDDITLNVLERNDSLDIAIVRANTTLPVADCYERGGIIPEVGDRVFLIGYPAGRGRATVSGIIARDDYITEEGRRHLLDLNGTFGDSGGPYLIYRNGALHWMGNINSVEVQPRDRDVPLFTVGIPVGFYNSYLEEDY